MKNLFKLFTIVLAIVMAFSLVACDKNNGDETETENGTTIDTESGQNAIADTSATYTSISDMTTALAESLSVEQKETALPESCPTGTKKITASGIYKYTSEFSDTISVGADLGVVHIYLDGVNISAEDKSVISADEGTKLIITLIGENTLSNSLGSKVKDKHVISTTEDLTINGNGTLAINSTKSAIACDKVFYGLSGTIGVQAVKHAITADSVYLDGLTIDAVSVGKDIIHAESDYDAVSAAPTFKFDKGFVIIVDGTIHTTTVKGDGIQADSLVYIKDGTFDITTTPTWNDNYTATENQESGMYNRTTHEKVSKDNVKKGSTYAVLSESVKGIKVGEIDYYLDTDTEQTNELTVASNDYTILIEGGEFNIETVDDAIHTNSGSALIYGGTFTIETSDDGIHADTNLKIAGNTVINVLTCYEGIEAQTIDISGGETTINALDDGVNATNSNLTESQQSTVCQINISGGRLDVTVNPNGDRDGIDSNGGIKITGGTVITRGPNQQMASPIDAANAISVTGGIVIVIGCAPGYSGSFSGQRGFMMPPNKPSGGGNAGGGNAGGGAVSEGSFTTTLTKTQSNTKGLSLGDHTVSVSGTTISYTNAYPYSGYTTVYASASATIN